MLAESQFFSDQYPKANDSYNELLEKYKYTQHLDKVAARQFAIGRYWEQLYAVDPGLPLSFQLTDATRPKVDTWGYALKSYSSVRMNDPTGPLADDSIMATANAYFLKGRYEDAAHHYDLIRKEYPKSEHQLNAHILGMKSKLEMYQGPMYDGTPLEEAKEIADATMTQFRGALGEERERIVQTQNHLLEQQANRHWRIAQYYDKKKHYGSARIYYRSIIDDFPTTEAAQKAGARLEEIRDLPANPPNYFEWISRVIPTSDK
jgi:tetratricopeptide (TPR) repeat protein